jgi:hypothetical protein
MLQTATGGHAMKMKVAALAGAMLCGAISMPLHGQQATATERYMLQERCGKQAAATFAKDYTPNEKTKDGWRIFNYESHFSAKLNKCFYLEVARFEAHGKWSRSLRLYDLNENKEYASFFDAGPNLMNCDVGEIACSSEKEWRDLTKPYLED